MNHCARTSLPRSRDARHRNLIRVGIQRVYAVASVARELVARSRSNRAFKSIATAITNSSLTHNMYYIGSPTLAMAEVRRHYVRSDVLDKQEY